MSRLYVQVDDDGMLKRLNFEVLPTFQSTGQPGYYNSGQHRVVVQVGYGGDLAWYDERFLRAKGGSSDERVYLDEQRPNEYRKERDGRGWYHINRVFLSLLMNQEEAENGVAVRAKVCWSTSGSGDSWRDDYVRCSPSSGWINWQGDIWEWEPI